MCNYSQVIFEQATKKLGEESQHKKHLLQNTINRMGSGKRGCFQVTWGTQLNEQKSLAFTFILISALKDTKSWGNTMPNKYVEIFVPIELSLYILKGIVNRRNRPKMELIFL